MRSEQNWKMDTVISIITGSRISRVRVDEIEAVEQDGRKLHVVTSTDDYACYATIDNLREPLLGVGCFYQPMRKLIINLDKVTDIRENEIHFISGASLIMGRNKAAEMKKRFKEYLMGYPSTVIGTAICCVSDSDNGSDII